MEEMEQKLIETIKARTFDMNIQRHLSATRQ